MDVHIILLGAVMTRQDQQELRAHVERHGRWVVLAAVKEWCSTRSLDVGGLKLPWGAWLREGDPYLQAAIQAAREQAHHRQWDSCWERIEKCGLPAPTEFVATL